MTNPVQPLTVKELRKPMIIDSALENYVPTVVLGPSVNAVAPDAFVPLNRADGICTYLVSGKPYGGALWKIARPLLPNTGRLSLQFEWQLSPDALAYGHACEFDTRITDAEGWTYPCDFQFVLEGGFLSLEIATGVAAGNIMWNKIGESVTALLSPVQVEINYEFDTAKRVCSIPSVVFNKTLLDIAVFQNQPAVQLGWGKSEVVLQKQMEVGASGGALTDVMSAIQYMWS